jgi:TnpA family transposase
MAQITQNDFTFTILDEIQVKYPELVELVLGSESIDNNEKQYWFDILPSMTDEQVDRLFNILMTERRQLEELNLKYQEEIKTLNDKHLIQWQSLQSQKTREKVQAQENKDGSKEEANTVIEMLDTL